MNTIEPSPAKQKAQSLYIPFEVILDVDGHIALFDYQTGRNYVIMLDIPGADTHNEFVLGLGYIVTLGGNVMINVNPLDYPQLTRTTYTY